MTGSTHAPVVRRDSDHRAFLHNVRRSCCCAEARRGVGALRAMQLQSEASTDLARVAAVQRSLDRALTLHTKHRRGTAVARPTRRARRLANLLNALRAQLELTWALHGDAGSRRDHRHSAAARRAIFRKRRSEPASGRSAAAPPPGHSPTSSRAGRRSKPRLRESMTRMRAVLQRVETRVLAEADRSGARDSVADRRRAGRRARRDAHVLGDRAFHPAARSATVGEVAQALAAGDMDNRCDVARLRRSRAGWRA